MCIIGDTGLGESTCVAAGVAPPLDAAAERRCGFCCPCGCCCLHGLTTLGLKGGLFDLLPQGDGCISPGGSDGRGVGPLLEGVLPCYLLAIHGERFLVS